VPTRTQLDATRSVMRTMYRVRHKDGGWRHVEDRSVLFHHADGRPVRMVGCTMDVTARVKAEEELRLVAEVAGLGAIRIDYAADTATPDATAADLFGLEAGVSVPRAVVHSRFHADDRDEVMRRMRASFDPHGPGGFAMEHRVVLPDGTMRWLSVRKQVTFGEVDGVRRPTSAVLAAVDVSARRATELRLEESFALLDSLMRNAPVGLSYHDRELRIVRINDYLAAINGLPVEAHIGRRVAEVVPDVWPRLEPLYRSALAGDPVVGVEVEGEVASAPGERRHYVVSCYPVRTADAILGIGVVVADITARKRAEAELNSSQQRLAAVLDATPALVYHMDADDRFVLVNRRFESLFGVTAEGVRGLTPYALFSAEIADAFVMNNRRVREEGRPLTFEEVAPHADGLHFYTSEKAPVVDDGVPVGVVGVSTDITIRRRAEDRTRLLSDAAAVLLSTDEPDVLLRGVFEKIAPAFDLDMYFDFMLDEAGAGLRLASSAGVTDDTARALQRLPFGQHMCGMVALSRRPAYASHVQTSDDPQVALVRGIGIRAYACNPLLSGNTLLGTLSFGSRRRDEFSVEELGFFSTISRYVSAAYERLRLVNELREADRKKDEFLATLAHELRNPLAPIRTGVQVMKLSAGNASMVERSRAMIERQVHQMAHLIDDLMDVSRISMGKVVLQKSRLRLADAVRDAVDISRPLLEAAGHDFTLELPADALVVDGDHTRLTQVFGNLLNNAAKYTARGGRVRLAVRRDGEEAVVVVEDSGVGIPAHMLGRVFDMFTQVDRSLERSQGGLGIGLNIVRRLVELHGGSITAASDGPDRGSTFTVRLPAVPVAETSHGTNGNGAAVKPSATRRRILVVDDNTDGAESLALMLGMMGHDTRTAHDGVEAVTMAEAFRPHLILMDIGMPRLSGLEACVRIRAEPWGRSMVLVAQTGWGQDADRQQAARAGFDMHLIKPVSPVDLTRLLEELPAAMV
jgi:PAS domain S-box-containing protein